MSLRVWFAAGSVAGIAVSSAALPPGTRAVSVLDSQGSFAELSSPGAAAAAGQGEPGSFAFIAAGLDGDLRYYWVARREPAR